jgi:hypothetical protein
MNQTKILILAVALSLAACTSVNQNTGEREFDPVKTAKVKAAAEPLISGGIAIALANNPEKKDQLASYFRSLGNVFCRMSQEDSFNPEFLLTEANTATQPFQAGLDPYALTVKDSIIALYKILYADRFHAELDAEKWPKHVADVLCNGINQGLTNAGL